MHDPLNPDLDDIFHYAQRKSGLSMYDFMVKLGGMSRAEEVDYLHKYEQEMIENAKKRLQSR